MFAVLVFFLGVLFGFLVSFYIFRLPPNYRHPISDDGLFPLQSEYQDYLRRQQLENVESFLRSLGDVKY